MARIPNATIEQIKARADVLEVVSDVVQLRQRGRNYFGLCPFHEEKTGSFSINPSMGIFHCFGCGKGGNAVTFIMEYEKIDYVEALKRLAERYHIRIDWEETGEDREQGEIALLYELHDLAMNLYHQQIFSEKGKTALDYLIQRGFSQAIIKQFTLGFATDDWENLFRKIDAAKFSPGVLEKSGLLVRKEGTQFYDRFRNRIIFPIHNLAGRVVAFGGRTMDANPEASGAKYINSAETPIYFKSGILYGLHYSKDQIQRSGAAIIVEGYTDFLRMFISGIQNVAAGSGTALTFHHAKALKRFTNQTILCYDGDAAGQNATERAGFILLKEGIDVKAISLPPEDDPDSYLRTHSVADFNLLYKNAPDFITFYTNRHQLELTSPASKTLFLEKVVAELIEIKNPVTRELIVQQIGDRLHLSEELINSQIRFLQKQKAAYGTSASKPESIKEKTIQIQSPVEKAEYELVKIILTDDPPLGEIVTAYLKPEQFSHAVLKKIYTRIVARLEESKFIQPASLFDDEWTEQEKFYLSRLLFEAEHFKEKSADTDLQRTAKDCIVIVLVADTEQQIKQLRDHIKVAEKANDDTEKLIIELSNLRRKRKEIEHLFTAIAE